MSNKATVIDRLGHLKAQLAELLSEEKTLKTSIIDMGVGAHEGELFRVTVSESERETLDMEAVRGKLTPQFIRAHTIVTDVVTVRVTSRNNVKLRIAP